MKGISIYDDKCAACTAFGRHRAALAFGYSTRAAKRLMEAQFGRDYGFTLMLFTQNRVYWGSDAAAELSKVGFSPFGGLYNALAHSLYPLVVKLLSLLLKRKTLPRPPAFRHKRLPPSGSMALTKKAKKELERISAGS